MDGIPSRPPLAHRRVWSAAAVVGLLLSATSARYGYHRDELYFRVLQPAWSYQDQPGLTPWLVRSISGVVDEVWAVRVPATLCLVLSVVVVAAVTRELGGGAPAQTMAAWGYGLGAFPLTFGHVMLTASVDLVVWPLVGLLVIRALLRDPRWWVAAGAVAGISTSNKLLVVLLVGGLVVGLAVAGPRRELRSVWFWLGGAAAALLALPAVLYQVANDWPQAAMGAALSAGNAEDVRGSVVPFLAILLGPPLVLVCAAGAVALWRRPDWRRVRLLPVALVVVVAATVAGGAQVYYPLGVLTLIWAAGCVPVAGWAARAPRRWRVVVVPAMAVNAVVCAVISLPLLPVPVLARTPVPDLNQIVRDQIGWPEHAAQVRAVVEGLSPQDRAQAVVLATNYGEAGALDRFGPASALPPIVSGHNALADQPLPAGPITVAVVVGEQVDLAETLFAECATVATLDNGVGVDNEEQGQPVAVCRDPVGGFAAVWPQLRHLD